MKPPTITSTFLPYILVLVLTFTLAPPVRSQEQSLQIQHESLSQSEAQLRFAEQVARTGHWVLDLSSNRYQFSEGAQKLLGLDDSIQNMATVRDMVLPEYRQQMMKALEELIERGRPYNINVRLRQMNGQLIELNSQGIYDSANRQVFGVIQDITAAQEALRLLTFRTRFFNTLTSVAVLILLGAVALLTYSIVRGRKAEAALLQREQDLRESHDMTQLVLNSTAEGIYGIDLHGICTFCNAACLKLLGYQHKDQLIGRNMHSLIHHNHTQSNPLSPVHSGLLSDIGSRKQVDNELFWRADGSSFPVEYWSYPVRRENQLIGAVVTFFDITERKEAQSALEQKNQEMERFVYTVSHDLKSPLVTVKSFLSLLQQDIEEGDAEQIKTDIKYIHGATDKMEQLLGALLQLSRIGSTDNKPETRTVNDLVNECLTTLAGSIHAKEIDIVAADVPLQLHGDAMRLGQIWQNLIENAIKYMGDQRHPRVEIGMERQPVQPAFYVRDNGMGIAEQDRERVFGLFAQLNPQNEGSGLGLALVRKIVESCKGRIWVTSEGAGMGSCFYFTLPRVIVRENEVHK